VTAARLLTELRHRGVVFDASSGRLRLKAPPGTVTAVDRSALRRQHADVLELLTADAKQAAFAALDVDVHLRTLGGDVWLVPSPTGADRPELTPADLQKIALVQSAFLGARVTAVSKVPPPATEDAGANQPLSLHRHRSHCSPCCRRGYRK